MGINVNVYNAEVKRSAIAEMIDEPVDEVYNK